MTNEQIMKQIVSLSEIAAIPADNFSPKNSKAVTFGIFSVVRHNYLTDLGEMGIYDVYRGGNYVASFKRKAAAIEYMHMIGNSNNDAKFGKILKRISSLDWEMHETIVELLKEHNGIIRTDKVVGTNFENDDIFVLSMQSDDEPFTLHRVLAVALIGEEQVAVLPALKDNETIVGMNDQEILECDNWEWINGGYVDKTYTLKSICESIEEYI